MPRNTCVTHFDIRLAPEHPFPTPINDGYEGLKWVRFCLWHLSSRTNHGTGRLQL